MISSPSTCLLLLAALRLTLPLASWRFTEGGSDPRAIARGGAGGGTGYSFRSHPHVCFCERMPCPHAAFTGVPSEHKVLPCTQEKADREQVTRLGRSYLVSN